MSRLFGSTANLLRNKDMSLSDDYMQELSTLIKETGERLIEDHYPKFCDALGELGLFGSDGLAPVPLELWRALAQAFADASGYRIVLQAEILQPIECEAGSYRSAGHREVASAEPTCFVQSVGE
jgi:hypothetical protein